MAEKPSGNEKPISLAPLDFERALKGLLQAGPHVEDEDDAPEAIKRNHETRRKRRTHEKGASEEAPSE